MRPAIVYLLLKEASDQAPVAPPPLDLMVVGSDVKGHLAARSKGYVPLVLLGEEGQEPTHLVYTHRRGYNAAVHALHADRSSFMAHARGLLAPPTPTPGGNPFLPAQA
jgi:hypothetical protein